jgi:hypothetical protein
MSSKTIVTIADIGSFIVMRWFLGWSFVLSFLLSCGVGALTYFILKQMGKTA